MSGIIGHNTSTCSKQIIENAHGKKLGHCDGNKQTFFWWITFLNTLQLGKAIPWLFCP